MSNSWDLTPLSECLSKVIDYRGRTPKKLGLEWSTKGYRALSANNVKFDGLERLESISYADENLYKKWMKDEVLRGDLLLTSEAPSGQVMLWDSDEKIVLSQRLYALRANEQFDEKFLKYYLQSPMGQKEIFRNNSGSTVSGISAKAFSNILVRHPCKSAQEKIGHILYSIDKKIDCNKRANAELETMAKALYDYWFVQFDFPNSNGKPYKSSGGKMIYSPALARDIPDGWAETSLAEITPISNESINPSSDPNKEFRHISIPVFDIKKTYGIELGKTIGSNKFTVIHNDLLVSKLNPWFNRVVYATNELDQICSTEFVVWRSPTKNIKNFLFLIATSQQFISHCVQSATGTSNSHKRVNPAVMMRFKIPYEHDLAEKFGKLVEPILSKLFVNQQENQQLAELRDWLLPMLMNGQVTVA